jgi:hypothetical protein
MAGIRRISVLMAGLLLSLQASAAIYKYIDKDGNLVLTDQKVPGSVLVPEHPVMTMPFPKGDTPKSTAASGATDAAAAYHIVIGSPAADATFRRNSDQVVPIAVSVDPQLKSGLSLELLLDGAHFDGDALPLDQVTRGAHSLSARIIDGNGKIIQSGPSNTFYVQQMSAEQHNAH